MRKLLRYILTHDTGDAPCIEGGIITLATCKPKIRGTAAPGDWVAGFMPRPFDRGLLVYAGRIKQVLSWREYEPAFPGRRDAAYRIEPDGGLTRLRPEYHPDGPEQIKDLSAPVLIFDPSWSWYFGQQPRLLPEHLIHLAAAGRGHRVSGTTEAAIDALEAWLVGGAAAPGVHGAPSSKRPSHARSC